MSATITWQVNQMSCYPEFEGETDVVFRVIWTCNGSEVANGQTYQTYINNSVQVTLTQGSAFTPYAQLTQEQVLGWVWASGVDQSATEAAVQAQLNALINPPVVTPPLPWATPAA